MPGSRSAKTEKYQYQKRLSLLITLLPISFIIGLALGYGLWGMEKPAEEKTSAIQPKTEVVKLNRHEVSVDDDPFWGPEDAAITIVEFSDYECPFCTKWHVEVWPRLQQAFPDQVKLVYRDFPLTSIHSNAVRAAEAANCAHEQNAFWEYNELLFQAPNGLGENALKKYAANLNLEIQAFTECLESRRYKNEVEADFKYATTLGVRSTPTLFINGIPVVGAQPFEVFQEIIQKELAGELPE